MGIFYKNNIIGKTSTPELLESYAKMVPPVDEQK